MKTIFKKLTALIVAMMMVLSFAPTAFAGIEYSMEDAFNQCAEIYPYFVETVTSQGVSNAQIITFLESVQTYLLGLDVEITEENFEGYLIEGVNNAMTYRKNIAVRDALLMAFPEAAVDGMDGIIHEDFVPIVETVKLILFGGEEVEKPTEEPTEKPTEEPTEKPTEPTEEPTEEKTEADKPSGGDGGSTGGNGGGSTGGSGGGTATGGNEDADDTPVEEPTQPKVQFSDMNQAEWAREAVYALVERGIINGYEDGTFRPNRNITRAEFAKIIVIAAGKYDKNATCTFTDVPKDQWYYSYVASAYKEGFINGRSAEIFDPNSNITRADVCTIVYRFVKSINPLVKANGNVTFTDAADIPVWAVEAVTVLNTNKVADVLNNNKFEPVTNATRAQCAQILYRAINLGLGINIGK